MRRRVGILYVRGVFQSHFARMLVTGKGLRFSSVIHYTNSSCYGFEDMCKANLEQIWRNLGMAQCQEWCLDQADSEWEFLGTHQAKLLMKLMGFEERVPECV
jgi:hypothetical protein